MERLIIQSSGRARLELLRLKFGADPYLTRRRSQQKRPCPAAAQHLRFGFDKGGVELGIGR